MLPSTGTLMSKRSLVFAALLTVLSHSALAQVSAEKCFVDDQAWTPPVGLTTVKRVVAVGGGAAGGADNAANFGMGGQAAPNGGATGGTGWGAGGGGGTGGGGGQAGAISDLANVAVSGPVSVTVGDRGTAAGANGTQSCFGTTCAAGGTGGGAFQDFSPVGGGQAGWGGVSGTGTKTSSMQDLGTLYVGQTTAVKTITVVNNSGAATTFQSISAPSTVSISNDTCSGKLIAAGANCTFGASISPTSAGTTSRSVPVKTDRGILNVALQATAQTPPTCGLPWGGSIAHGSSVTAYADSWVAYGGSCYSQTRTCSYGSLSGSYTNSGCTVQPGASCSLPWGGSIGDGGSVYAYGSSSVPYGGSCSGQWRTCYNGSLSGSYSSSSCSVQAAASCSLPWGGAVAHGGSVTAYATSSGSTCTSETRSCNNGSLSGSYSYGSCTKITTGTWSGGYMQAAFCGATGGYAGGSKKSGACTLPNSNSWAINTSDPSCPADKPISNQLWYQDCNP